MSHTVKQADTDKNISKLHKSGTTPTRKLLSPFDDLDQLFNQLRTKDWMRPFHWSDESKSHTPMFARGRQPKVDIIDRDKDLLVRAELPGVDKKDLEISMTDNSVTFKATSRYEESEENGDYYHSEIVQGQYIRTIGLPADVDLDQVKTSFKDGVLELTIPKLERSQRKSIKVE